MCTHIYEYIHQRITYHPYPKGQLGYAYKNKIKAKKGAKELLKHLKENNIKIAIVTSNSHELIEAGLKNNNLYNYIDLGLLDVINADLPMKLRRNTKTSKLVIMVLNLLTYPH